MKRKVLITISIFVVLTLAACGGGPAPAPTLNVTEIQNAALTQAWVAMTMTQAALPTNTAAPIPPSPTPFPTFASLPTLQPVAAPTLIPPTAQTASVCNQVPPVKPQGALVQVEFVNKSGGQVNLSFGMNTPNDKGECVTYSFSLNTYQTLQTTVLAGCYWGYGWVSKVPPTTSRTPSQICLDDPTKIPPLWIEPEVMYLH